MNVLHDSIIQQLQPPIIWQVEILSSPYIAQVLMIY